MTKATCADSTGAPVAHPQAGECPPGHPAIPFPSNTRRRGLLAGFGAVMAAAAVPVPVHGAQMRALGRLARDTGPDARLLPLSREFLAQHAIVAAWNAGRIGEESGDAAHVRWRAVGRKMADMPATTAPGMVAKAKCALLAFETMASYGGPGEDLTLSVLRDVAGRAQA